MKSRFIFIIAGWLLLGRLWAGGTDAPEPGGLCVTTTLIETAARDLLGDSVRITRLLPPGSCPGHFDLAPEQVQQLTSAALFIRHDYQAGYDAQCAKAGVAPDRIVSLASHPTYAIPSNYVALCTALCHALAQLWPEQAPAINARLAAIQARAVEVEARMRGQTAPLKGRKVLCARYQKDFCAWAGLEVVAVYSMEVDGSAWQLSRAVDMAQTAGAQAVIGNLQWGPRHLAALAEATGLPGIMLSNFPAEGAAGAYWDFAQSNVVALLGVR